MCGRFAITAEDAATIAHELAQEFGIDLARPQRERLTGLHRARYNVAPSQSHWFIDQKLCVDSGEWGFKLKERGERAFNARAETVDRQPLFRPCLEERRALVLCTHFYEWNTVQRGAGAASSEPWVFRPRGLSYFALAALVEAPAPPPLRDSTGPPAVADRRPQEQLPAFTLVTVPANGTVAHLHPRMPAILGRRSAKAWLSAKTSSVEAKALLRPAPDSAMSAMQVDPWVNDPAHDDARCLQTPRQTRLF